jgi:hypothetical protein
VDSGGEVAKRRRRPSGNSGGEQLPAASSHLKAYAPEMDWPNGRRPAPPSPTVLARMGLPGPESEVGLVSGSNRSSRLSIYFYLISALIHIRLC